MQVLAHKAESVRSFDECDTLETGEIHSTFDPFNRCYTPLLVSVKSTVALGLQCHL